MKIWFNEFLQNAAFPAVVLAFACSPINNEIPDVRTGRSTDPRKAEKTLISYIDTMNRSAHALQALAFEKDLCAKFLVERARCHDRSAVGVAFDAHGGCRDIVESGQAECAHR